MKALSVLKCIENFRI